MRIAISGAGVAGPTLAYWLRKGGHEPFLIEKASELRTGGYVIDFWGLGYQIAEKMGVIDAVLAHGYQVQEVRFVGDDGRRVSGFPVDVLADMTQGRFTSLPRGDLAGTIFDTIRANTETRFGDSIAAMEEHADGIHLTLESGETRDVDLLVGADGLHSKVRSLAFGPQSDFERDLGYVVAAFNAPDYTPRDEDVYVMRAWPGRSISRFALRDGTTLLLFVMARECLQQPFPQTDTARKQAIRQVFEGAGWETAAILSAMDRAGDLYFDRVSQIEMPTWTKGRVALIGDAAACASLLAGEGTGLGMTKAYVLAAALAHGDDYRSAFSQYDRQLQPFLRTKQRSARQFAGSFAPKTRLALWTRNLAARMLALPGAAKLLLGNSVQDDFTLPDFPAR
ncbi:FAD-binding domain [Stakelama sediminis]|uniref:2-polyprenyl-6-methoxyphenol hydroxylase-like FAD-dependent oxidoreductase n=1 Tax=Stakelama sediminis TaxID=463200 RepID=A0A840YYA6_9SPHN|nr:FAD-binding domain [Stakelama sediminis]MBB5718504.1 2-polyprenyl-6-methoxyphenol hydroxylase-like FAD-dependent oxidoreductase [Stakelama sediminis]